MGFFGRKKDKEKEKEKKGGLFGWMKRKQTDEPEREAQIVEPEPETDTDDVAAQMLAEREAARQAETEQWREEPEAEIAADQAEAGHRSNNAAMMYNPVHILYNRFIVYSLFVIFCSLQM